jgi:hypothetical protein
MEMEDGVDDSNQKVSNMAQAFLEKLKTKGIKATKRETKNGIFIYGEKNNKGKYLYETYISFEEKPENLVDFLELEESEFYRLHKTSSNSRKALAA